MTDTTAPIGDPREPDRSFRSAREKVGWAEHVASTFFAGAEDFVTQAQTAAAPNVDSTGQMTVTNLHVPAWIPLMLGDIIFNLRSSLDCCWSGLARARKAGASKETLPRGTLDQVRSRAERSKLELSFPGITKFLEEKVAPFEHGNNIIWMLAQLDNWNKHNMLVVAAQRTILPFFMGQSKSPSGVTTHVLMENNVFLGGGPRQFADLGPDFKITGQSSSSVDLLIEIESPELSISLLPFLRESLSKTKEIVELFSNHFGQPHGT